MSTRKQKLTIATICTLLGLVAGTLTSVGRVALGARAMASELITTTAQQVVAPVRADLDAHLKEESKEHPEIKRHNRKVERILMALCQANPRARCVEADREE